MRAHESFRRLAVITLLICSALAATAAADEPFTNADVITLTELGMEEAIIVGKIQQAIQVEFQLETDDLVALKGQGVTVGVIAAMLARVTADQAGAAAGGGAASSDRAEVTMITDEGEFELLGNAGNYSTTYAVITVLAFMDYHGDEASVRTEDTTPSFVVATEHNPNSTHFLCRAEQDDDEDKRSVKAGQIGMWGAQSVMRPDPDWSIDYEATEIEPGVWRLEPEEALVPGEYAVWKASGETMGTWNAYLYDFAVDGDPPPAAEGKKKKKNKKK
jgi:hypothetical protein